ncbi:efflux RND transporter permease subunit [uncultured Shewanella sp.]|uniref:efflux RND transporter permease subunit n=1 Tax=uncultured Shewanella sp. TaxID=173975 RepID=UPI00260D68CF|nr:efflux RND transporter permease subunit [uncultured Shewanella sp.]
MKFVDKYSGIIIAFSALLVLLGGIASVKLPNALLPDLDQQEIAMLINWQGKTATEIEQVLITPLERQLASIGQLKHSQSFISNGETWMRLFFSPQADMEKAYMDVMARINQIPDWPAQVAKPLIFDYSNGAGSTVASMYLYSELEEMTPNDFRRVYRQHIASVLSDVSGIANINMSYSPLAQRMDIEFNPKALAHFSLSIDDVTEKLHDLIDRSGDKMTLGSKAYGLHFKGQMALAELTQLPVAVRGERIIRLGEIAQVHRRFVTEWDYSSFEGHPAMYFSFQPEKNTNALNITDELSVVMTELNQGVLADLGMKLSYRSDSSKPIKHALSLVYTNILLGVLLACLFLYLFIRDLKVVFLIFISIPVCLSLVILGMYLGGRSLNVISMAGMALSVGLLLDASIIVMENIQRLRDKGLGLIESVYQGVKQVRGALISSTLSSIVIFVPIILMQSSISQMFEDLAYTISTALVASILVALILLPALGRWILSEQAQQPEQSQQAESKPLSSLNKWPQRFTMPSRSPLQANIWVGFGIVGTLLLTWWVMPAIDLLPNPKADHVIAYVDFKEPLSQEAATETIGKVIEARFVKEKAKPEAPRWTQYVLSCNPSYCYLNLKPEAGEDYTAFEYWLKTHILHDLPDTDLYVRQGNLLGGAIQGGDRSRVDFKGLSLGELQKVGQDLKDIIKARIAGSQVLETVALSNNATQIEFTPKADKLAYLGLSRAELNQYLVALTDGEYLGRFSAGNESFPFYFKGQKVSHIEQLLETELMIPDHGLIPLRDLVDSSMVLAPSAIFRADNEMSISLGVVPPNGQPMGPFVDQVKAIVSEYIKAQGPDGLYVAYQGQAGELDNFLSEFLLTFLVSLLVLFLLMRIALASWLFATAVMLSMPLALAGGMLSLNVINVFMPQNLDVITMIGFIILMGLVINNAILLISEFKAGMEEGLMQQDAIYRAVSTRMRPIFMSTGTSIFGMLPLMLTPGDGAEIYRGLASVIVGGMTFSALFTLSFMSALLSLPVFGIKPKEHKESVGNEDVLVGAS